MEELQRLGIALALGLLIGIERGWHERTAAEGQRIAGIRTFGLIGLLGAITTMLALELGILVLGLAFVALAAVLITAHILDTRQVHDYGITTVIAALLTFALGALAMAGHVSIAATVAVISTILLSLKPLLHRWLERLEQNELFATLKLLLISVVMLPVLPDRGFGPWQALNPYEIWWLVVLIAAISFAGYFAIKLAGTRRGVMFTSLFGGLASSTVITLNFSRLGRKNVGAQALLAAGVVVAAVTMFPRMLLEVSVVNPALLPQLLWPLLTMSACGYLLAFILWRNQRRRKQPGEIALRNPFELLPALQFAVLLVVVMLLSKAFQAWLGDAGIYLLAAFAGISDVDAITLSLARFAREGLEAQVAGQAIVLAAMVNTLVKGALVATLCGGEMGRRVALAFGLTIVSGGLVVAVTL